MAERIEIEIDPAHRRWLAAHAARQGFPTPETYLEAIVELALQLERLQVGDLGRDWHGNGNDDDDDDFPF
jgi:hypothetical protein